MRNIYGNGLWIVALMTVAFLHGCGGSDLLDRIDGGQNGGSDYGGNEIPSGTLAARIVEAHNRYRSELNQQIPDLEWSDTIAHDAKHYADILAASGEFEHDPDNVDGYSNGPYGENLYAISRSDDPEQTLLDAVEAWGAEKAYYHYGVVGDPDTCDTGEQCGHYTQIIWKETRKVGCAIAQYTRGDFQGGYVVVCKYAPPGNVITQAPY